MYNMTGIAKFYNKFCHSSNWTRPDPRVDPTRVQLWDEAIAWPPPAGPQCSVTDDD